MMIRHSLRTLACLATMALVGCYAQPDPNARVAAVLAWGESIKSEYARDSDRCRATAKNTQSTPEEVRAMMSLSVSNDLAEGGLEEGRYHKCMLATGKYPFLDMGGPDPRKVQELKDAADAQARIEILQKGKTVDRITPESIGYADETAQMCGVPTNALQDALRLYLSKHPSFDPDGLAIAKGRLMRKSNVISGFSVNSCTNIRYVITHLTAAFNRLSRS
jgi:hypothetical protein